MKNSNDTALRKTDSTSHSDAQSALQNSAKISSNEGSQKNVIHIEKVVTQPTEGSHTKQLKACRPLGD